MPQPQSPLKPTVKEPPKEQTSAPVEVKEPVEQTSTSVETIHALQDENGVPIQPPLEEDKQKVGALSALSPTPAPVTPAPVMLAVGQSAGVDKEDSPVAAPFWSPVASPAYSPALLPVLVERA